MKKEEVYRLIEYNGVYDDRVKKNLKKIIKKYHPDKNNNDNKIIQVIYAVKKELENNQVSYNPTIKVKEEHQNNNFISKNECLRNIERLQKEKKNNDVKLKELHKELSDFLKEYSDMYTNYCTSRNSFCEVQDRIKELKRLSIEEIIIYLIFLVIIFINIFNYNTLNLVILIFFLIFLIIWNVHYYNQFNRIKIYLHKLNNENNSLKVKVDDVQNKINLCNDKINNLERCNEKIKCDIRFYKNMMN